MTRVARQAWLAVGLSLLTGCGSFQPFATPFVPRPALPRGDPFPDMTVEEAVERLEALGFVCDYEQDSDMPGGWRCSVGQNGLAVEIPEIIEVNEDGAFGIGIAADETGPISSVGASLPFAPDHPKEALDAAAAEAFSEILLAVFVPDEVRPEAPEMQELVAANWPAELGEGWLVGFERNSIHRSMRIVYSEVDAEEAP